MAGRHLFKSDVAPVSAHFMSDALASALAEVDGARRRERDAGADMRWLQLGRVEETDAPWLPEVEIAPWLDWARRNPARAADVSRHRSRGARQTAPQAAVNARFVN
jgi:hypothetical protein